MSDYISKSALIKNLQDWKFQECPIGICEEETETYKAICECIKAVNEQPTLDEKEIIRKPFERVVERLEEKAKSIYKDKNEGEQFVFLKDAIEICKEEGGLNELD